MENIQIVGLVGFIVTMITIISPIIKLNSTIVKLNTNFENMLKNDEIRDRRIDAHEKEILVIKEQQKSNANKLDLHEVRINSIENKIK